MDVERVTVTVRDDAVPAHGVRFFDVRCTWCGVLATADRTLATAQAHAATHRASHRARGV